MRIGAEITKDIINSQQLILPGYYLSIKWIDDTCNAERGTQAFLQAWHNDTKWLALASNGCSAVCMSTAIVAHELRIPQISYGCASGSISNTKKYPDLTRFMVVEDKMADVFNALGTKWGWKEIHIITGEAARFDGPAQRLLDYYKDKTIAATWLTPRNPKWEDALSLMQKVKTTQQRVLVVLGYEPFYRKMICAAFKVGMPKGVVWLSVGWHKANWFSEYDAGMMDPVTGFAPDCTVEVIKAYFEGGIGATGYGKPLEQDMDNSLGCMQGYTARQFHQVVGDHFAKGYPIGENKLPGEPYWDVLGNAPDGTCLYAYLVRHMFDLGYSLSDLQRPNEKVYNEMIRFIKVQADFFWRIWTGQVCG